jgi:phosphate starvation-inducible PhoH-like protein
VERGADVVRELRALIERKGFLPPDDFDRILLRGHRRESPADEGAIDVYHKARMIEPIGPGQKAYVKAIREHDLVFCTGPAGSGKTYLATAMAVNALRQELVRKIVLVRPAVEAGEKLGFLPGDMLAKVNPYLRPLLDALGDILDYDQVQRYLDKDIIEIIPMAFMRGRTLNNTFIILDEGQNTTVTQMKMFLTRMGQHSRIVVTGDVTQIDLPEHVPSGLIDAVERLRRVAGVGVIQLTGEDIVRHPLVRRIVAAYDTDRSLADAGRAKTPEEVPAQDCGLSIGADPATSA